MNNPLTLFNDTPAIPPYMNVPSGMPPSVVQNNEMAGNYKDGPMPVFLTPGPQNKDLMTNIRDIFKDAGNWARNDYAYGRPTAYAAGWQGANFERYYNHPNFNKLGFNPRIDNETIYNANSTWWDDFVRMGNFWFPLSYSGFKSPYDFGSEDTAQEFSMAMAHGMSSKGGIGSFFTNLSLQSAHTLGMISEVILEQAALRALDVATGGATSGLSAMNFMKNVPGLRKAFQFGDAVKSINDLRKEMNSLNTTREVVDAVNKSGTIAKIGRAVNPFTSTTEYITNIYNGANGFREMSQFVKMKNGAGAVFRDLREMNLAISEATMEGAMSRVDYTDRIMNKFYEQNGRMPTSEEAKKIYGDASSVDLWVSITNAPIIFYSNKLVFDRLFKAFSPASAVEQTLLQGSKRKMIRNADWKVGESVYKFMQNSAGKTFKNFITRSPYLPWTKKYMMGNLSEGFQEVFQDVASDWWQGYYEDVYTDPSAAGMYTSLASLGSALGNTFSWRGVETFSSGFLMGSIVQGVGSLAHVPQIAPAMYKDLMKKGDVKAMQELRQQQENIISDTVNSVFNNSFMGYDRNVDNALKQKYLARKMDQAQRQANQAAFQDAKDEMMLEHLHSLASMNKMDLITEQVEALQQMDDVELSQAYNEPKSEAPKIRERLSVLNERAKSMQVRYDNYKRKFPNPFDMTKVDKEKDPTAYMQMSVDYNTWNAAVKDALMTESLFERNVERNQTIFNELGASQFISNAVATDITSIMTRKDLAKEISVLTEEVRGLRLGNAESKREADKKEKKLEALMDFRNNLDDYQYNYKRHRQMLVQQQNRSVVHKVGNIVVDKKSKEEYEILEINDDGSLLVMDSIGDMSFMDRNDIRPYTKNRMTETVLKKSNMNLYDSMRKYFAIVADTTQSNIPNDEKMMDAFNKIRDSYTLQNENEYLTKTMNILNNPTGLMEYADRLRGIIAIKHENYAKYLKDSWGNLVKVYKDNAFLNNLFSVRAAIDPDDAEKALKNGDFKNVTIYDIETGKPIMSNDERYPKIQEFIKQYTDAIQEHIAKKEKKEVKKKEEETTPEQEKGKLDEDTKNKLMDLIRQENKIRRKNDEKVLKEDIDDPTTAKWLAENDDAQDVINEYAREASSKRKRSNKPAEGETFKTGEVPEGLENIKGLWKKTVVLTEDGINYVDEDGKLFFRVSDLKVNKYGDTQSLKGQRASARGNVADHILRKVVVGDLTVSMKNKKPTAETVTSISQAIDRYVADKKLKIRFTDKAVKSLITAISEIQEFLDNNNLTLYSDIPSLWGELKGKRFAGTIDLLAKDSKGKYYIIDLKTNSPEYSRRIKSGEKKYMVNDTIQLNAYAELFYQRTGKKIAGAYIMPMMVTHNAENYGVVEEFVLDKDFDTDDALSEAMIPISMEKDIYELDQELGPEFRKVPLSKTKKTKAEAKETKTVETEGFNKAARYELRMNGFVSMSDQRDGDEIFGYTKTDAVGQTRIDWLENGDFAVMYTEFNEDKSALDQSTAKEEVYESLDQALAQALTLSDLGIAMMQDMGIKDKAMKRQNILAKINAIDKVDDYENYYDYMTKKMEDSKWIKDNGFKSSIELQEAFDVKAEELDIETDDKPAKKRPSKNKDTKARSKRAMDIIEYEADEVSDLSDELTDAEESDIDDLENDFLNNTKC